MTRFPSLIIEKGPNTKGVLFFNPSIGFACSDTTEEEDSGSLLLNIPHAILFKLIKRIEDKGPFHYPLSNLIPIEWENSYPFQVFSF